MWLCDLEIAIKDLHEVCPTYIFEKIMSNGVGIAFFTTHFTRVLWTRDGSVFERDENGNVKILK